MYETSEATLRGLQTVRVTKDGLLEKVKKNRDDHRAIFEEAIEGWKQAVIKALEEAVDDAKRGKDYRVHLGLVKPEDHTDDYDAVIALLEMSEDDELELTRQEFANYVLDQWGWQHTFLASSTGYVTSEPNRRRIQDKGNL